MTNMQWRQEADWDSENIHAYSEEYDAKADDDEK